MKDRNVIDLHIGRQVSDFDCGAQALQMVLAYYGVEIRGDELMKALGTGEDGTSVANMIAFSKSKGFEVHAGSEWTLRWSCWGRSLRRKHPNICVEERLLENKQPISNPPLLTSSFRGRPSLEYPSLLC